MKQRQFQEENKEDAQTLAVTVQNWHIVNMYGPPRTREEIQRSVLEAETWIGLHDLILMVGDWSQEPGGELKDIILGMSVMSVDQQEDTVLATRFSGKLRLV